MTVDHLLEQRAHRLKGGHEPRYLLVSLAFHGVFVAAMWLVPDLFAKPPEEFQYIVVTVVPPSVLGTREPPPPPPPPPTPEEEDEEPPTPEPEPEPVPEDVPVLVEEKEKKVEKKVEKKPEPPPPAPPPPPRVVEPPPKREGSPFGNPLGATSREATLGVEDPNFTYGYYLDRVVAVISSNWARPPLGSDIREALLHFRIERDGTVTDLRLVESSTSKTFDDAAIRAVQSSSPLPPLPKGYQSDHLGINLIVR